MTLYHVAQDYDGGDLRSLAQQLGESEAIETFCRTWPDADAALAAYHVRYVHLYATEQEARDHADAFGGQVLAINTDEIEDDVEMDNLEFDHPIVRNHIEAKYITVIA